LYGSSNQPTATVRRVADVPSSLVVAVLGAAGTIAPAIVHDLAESDEVARMFLLDLDGNRAAAVAEQHGGGKATAHSVDARDGVALTRRLQGVDVLLNTASYRVNLEAMQACRQAGCHYLDLGGLYWITRRQFELATDFENADLLAVLGIGSSPGKTNLMARRGVDELGQGERIERIEVVAAGRDLGAPDDGKLRPPYAIQTLLDELTLAPVVLRDGTPVEISALEPGGEVEFGDPIGRGATIYTLHSELATFGESFGAAEISFRLSLTPVLLERLEQLVGASEQELAEVAASSAPQSAQTVSVHLVIVTAASGRTATVRSITRPHFGLGGSVVSTATPAAAAVRLLARGAIPARGVLPPERCIDPAAMFAELEARGASFSVALGER
jgi:lysine 6-dehydrogenase